MYIHVKSVTMYSYWLLRPELMSSIKSVGNEDQDNTFKLTIL